MPGPDVNSKAAGEPSSMPFPAGAFTKVDAELRNQCREILKRVVHLKDSL